METIVRTLAELETEACRFVDGLAPSPRGATLVTLSGELGAGKTAFTKAVAKALGVTDMVTSPTFVLEKIYQLPECGHPVSTEGHRMSTFKRLVHIDAYRLESGKDLATLGFDELIQNSDNLIMLEWPEIVADALPAPSIRISIVANPDGSRTISYV
ncbi:MAG: tRNA (adenosine(37)-N6)-threonylcarbamoyltransferase complex ATPase subunit type 1 TsaE [Candidatus Paceibacterota bacterium]